MEHLDTFLTVLYVRRRISSYMGFHVLMAITPQAF